ncbi:uncharacterized protein LOC143293007 [Babylonia areolata]|uniref:uncharacterized protein LOC143293007 n=1 Tax=Babylonia areolata TaxID=304850 RepID=UPI003FD26745
MERKQLIERLESMKKELARKQRKLEKANRAARVKAHVRKKIQELNQQAEHDQPREPPVLTGSQNALPAAGQATSSSVVIGVQQQPPTCQHSSSEKVSLESGCIGIRNHVSLSGRHLSECANSKTEDLLTKQFTSTVQNISGSDSKTDAKETLLHVKHSSVQNRDESCEDSIAGHYFAAITDVQDSLAITPTFKSLRDMDADLPDSPGEQPVLHSFSDIDSCADTFTLNLDSEASLLDSKADAKLAQDSSTYENANNLLDKNKSNVAVVSTHECENLFPVKARMHQDKAECQTVSTPLDNIEMVSSEHARNCSKKRATQNTKQPPMNSSATDSKPESTSSPLQIPESNHADRALLRLQDISSEDDAAAVPRSDLPKSSSPSSSEKEHHDSFLDYTELDAIPFSQFELTEDFLSECSQHIPDGSQGRKRKKGILSLIQRRSPRLSSFEFDSCDTASEKQQGGCLRRQQTALYRMARKQRKSKQALFLSSLFQYLIDEAKRDTSFVEFKLPVDIANLASWSLKERLSEKQSVGALPQYGSGEHCTPDSQDTDVIPETELIPDCLSQRISDDTDTEDRQHDRGQSQSDIKASLIKAETSVNEVVDHSQNRTESALVKVERTSTGITQHVQDKVQPSFVNAKMNAAGVAQYVRHKDETSPIMVETSVLETTHDDQVRTQTRSDRKIRSPGAAETVSPLSKQSEKLTSHSSTVCAVNENQKSDTETENQETENEVEAESAEPTTHVQETMSDTPEDLDMKTKHSEVYPDRMMTHAHSAHTESRQINTETASAGCTQKCSVGKQTPKKDKCTPSVTMGPLSSPILFDAWPQHERVKEDEDPQRGLKKSVFSPSRSKNGDEPTETVDQNSSLNEGWVTFAGCLKSYCTDAVVDTVVGATVIDSEETPFILCVQATALTLWTLGNSQQWAEEFHWYLQKTSKAEGACRVYTADSQLAVLVWGFDVQSVVASPRLTLTVFVYHWDTHHTQRFDLPLPSPVHPARLFCHGLEQSADSVIVVSTAKGLTVGRKYMVDLRNSRVVMEMTLEEVSAQLTDLSLVSEMTGAVVGLTAEHTLLMWNHMNGALIFSWSLPDNLPLFSRMFSCVSLKGFLLFHMTEGDTSDKMYLVAVNPATNSGKIVKEFATHDGQPTNWLSTSTFQDSLLTVSSGGTAHLWDPCLGELLSLHTPSSKAQTVAMLRVRGQCIWLTGQDNGCVHLFSVLCRGNPPT